MSFITVKKGPSSDIERVNKKNVDVSLRVDTIPKFIQTVENYLKVSVGDVVYIPARIKKIQISDTTEFKFPNKRSEFLQS